MDEGEEIKKLLKENLKISEKIYKNTEKIRRYFFRAKVWKLIKFTVIAALIIVGFIYSKPYFRQISKIYKGAFELLFSTEEQGQSSIGIQNLDPAAIKQLQEILKTLPTPR